MIGTTFEIGEFKVNLDLVRNTAIITAPGHKEIRTALTNLDLGKHTVESNGIDSLTIKIDMLTSEDCYSYNFSLCSDIFEYSVNTTIADIKCLLKMMKVTLANHRYRLAQNQP